MLYLEIFWITWQNILSVKTSGEPDEMFYLSKRRENLVKCFMCHYFKKTYLSPNVSPNSYVHS